ncbi:MAG TPA: asparaginase [Telluria sp.]|nr:asparaginase [Telluria sp.]
MKLVPLVETTRGGHVENIHFGSVAVVDTSGKLLWYAGDPEFPTFTRSALKPFQALPFMLDDGPARLGLSLRDVAVMCASHSGEQQHVDTVRGILERIGLDESHLECGCHQPHFYETLNLRVPCDQTWTPLQHNCSGKHSGFLAWCALHGAPTAGYVDPDHPLQRAVRARLGETLGVDGDSLARGIDGCSAPNYAFPLSRMAHLYARLAQGAADPQWGAEMGLLREAMTTHPELVSGEGRSDLVYMKASNGDWVTKVGADAVQAVGVSSAGLGIAIKISDGAPRSLQAVTVSVLQQLGLMDEERAAAVERYRQPPLRNWRGTVVGDIRAVFRLARAGS